MPSPLYRLVETAPPGAEPLTLDEMKTHLRVDHDADDALISGIISAARQAAEHYTGRAFITRSYSLFIDAWPSSGKDQWWDGVHDGAGILLRDSSLNLPRPPLASVTCINVYDESNVATVYAASNYFTDTVGAPGRIVLKDGASAPAPTRNANGIEIQFKAGYGAAPYNVPAVLKQGLKQLATHLYQQRGDSPEAALSSSGAQALFQPYRLRSL